MNPGIPSIESFIKMFSTLSKGIISIYEDSKMQIYQKKDNSPLTQADLLSQKTIIDFLKQTKIPVIAEEEEETKKTWEKYMWVVDPLDGTSDFINHTGEFAIMIGLVKEKNPIFGVVCLPVQNKLYYAYKEKGAYMQVGNKAVQKMKMKRTSSLSRLTAVVSRNHFLKTDEMILKKYSITKKIHRGSVGVKVGLLCEGKADVLFNTSNKTSVWDTCAPQIIIEESEGMMTDLRGKKLIYDGKSLRNEYGILATNKLIYGNIIEKLDHEEQKK